MWMDRGAIAKFKSSSYLFFQKTKTRESNMSQTNDVNENKVLNPF